MKVKNWSTLFGVFVQAGVLTACACQTNVPVPEEPPDTRPVFQPEEPEPVKPAKPREPEPKHIPGTDAEGNPIAVFYFRLDDATLSSTNFAALRLHADILNDNPSKRIAIEGHCDERGTREYNLALGDRRAGAVERFLLSAGVDQSQMETVSYGEEKPVATESNEAAWALNRRAEVKYK